MLRQGFGLLPRWRVILLFMCCISVFSCSKPSSTEEYVSQPTATTNQDNGETDSIFICSVPEILQSHVDRILLDTTPASESRDPWSGTFMTKEVTLQLRNGTEIYIVLDDPLYLNASSRDSHDGCEKFTFRKFGKYFFSNTSTERETLTRRSN